MYRARIGYDLIPNRHIFQKTIEFHQSVHEANMKKINGRKPGTGTLDNNPPECALNSREWRSLRPNKMKHENFEKIEHQNKVLLQRMTKILTTTTDLFDFDRARDPPRTLHATVRKERLLQISKNNLKLLEILENTEPYYKVKKWEDERVKMEEVLERMHKNFRYSCPPSVTGFSLNQKTLEQWGEKHHKKLKKSCKSMNEAKGMLSEKQPPDWLTEEVGPLPKIGHLTENRKVASARGDDSVRSKNSKCSPRSTNSEEGKKQAPHHIRNKPAKRGNHLKPLAHGNRRSSVETSHSHNNRKEADNADHRVETSREDEFVDENLIASYEKDACFIAADGEEASKLVRIIASQSQPDDVIEGKDNMVYIKFSISSLEKPTWRSEAKISVHEAHQIIKNRKPTYPPTFAELTTLSNYLVECIEICEDVIKGSDSICYKVNFKGKRTNDEEDYGAASAANLESLKRVHSLESKKLRRPSIDFQGSISNKSLVVLKNKKVQYENLDQVAAPAVTEENFLENAHGKRVDLNIDVQEPVCGDVKILASFINVPTGQEEKYKDLTLSAKLPSLTLADRNKAIEYVNRMVDHFVVRELNGLLKLCIARE